MKIFAERAAAYRYLLTGVATALVYFLFGAALARWSDLTAGVIATLAFVAAVLFNYLMHFYFTFGQPDAHARTLRRYAVMTACGMAINWQLAELLYPLMHSIWLVQLFCMSAVVAWNMVLSAAWVFAAKGRV